MSLAIQEEGVPRVDHAATPKQDAIGLLMLAAEVEHALMAQYLYAAGSLRSGYARTVAHVAIQEMGHLLTVQNLLLALNGITDEGIPRLIHLGRDTIRRASTRNPLPFILEPISKDALAKFVVVERPWHISDSTVAQTVNEIEKHVKLLGVSANPLYALYAAIRWIFQADDTPDELGLSVALGFRPGWHLTDEDFTNVDIIDRLASTRIEWGSFPDLIVASVQNRAQCLAALDLITAQGEGLRSTQDSHFSSFFSLFQSFENGHVAVRPLPRTPRVPGQKISDDPTPTDIIDPETITWAELFNQCYELLLLDIAWTLSHEHGEQRVALIGLCTRTMTQVLRPLARDLTNRPLGGPASGNAGPPYALLNETCPKTRSDFRERYRECIARQRAAIDAITSRAGSAPNPLAALRLSAIEHITETRKPHLP
ncbi:MAG TPA: ferritin-like domain-containing protein [Dyella sp.]|uniref:ferritin-like domain-containing protein n=1 Tax=Dyella sp. TaxID=1869338 RepID=UPI002D0A76B7|nr:ferritin-like domain-containing protein [Dyella sp.]HUB89902.1 ferritin-like domain-containing protein [Dyella sp.]